MRQRDRASSPRASWQGYVIALALTVGAVAGLFYLKINTSSTTIITARILLLGVIAGSIASIILIRLKKPAVLSALTVILYALWFAVPYYIVISPAFLGGGAVCCIALTPFLAARLTPGSPKRPGLSELEKMNINDL